MYTQMHTSIANEDIGARPTAQGVVLASLVLFLLTGCSPERYTPPTARPPSARVNGKTGEPQFDLGVLFCDEQSYMCWPLEELGITPEQKVQTINSSCSCVAPSLVSFMSPTGPVPGLRVDVVADETVAEHPEFKPAMLGVELTFDLSDGTSQKAVIKFLHTLQRRGSESASSADLPHRENR
ncbi:MAG: hypothetical protein Aurels2KO_50950 [Aureliella sp.]